MVQNIIEKRNFGVINEMDGSSYLAEWLAEVALLDQERVVIADDQPVEMRRCHVGLRWKETKN
jgi:hypothetical protein